VSSGVLNGTAASAETPGDPFFRTVMVVDIKRYGGGRRGYGVGDMR
jgi:hypothetical protein